NNIASYSAIQVLNGINFSATFWLQFHLFISEAEQSEFRAANQICLQPIDDEWQKTQCVPRESCVDVAKELGRSTNTFFKPPCVSVYRCGGCCNEEGLVCKNISTSYISKAVSATSLPFLCSLYFPFVFFKKESKMSY
uniref:Platelet-derived growth factor (PDGF) family profile domain-containing protein n=1 Tax=Callorhinchus milii TaxID=7868 RepID=A0A4W3HXY3_CALMI